DGLFFIDSRTTIHTVATKIAKEQQVSTIHRDIFLDTNPAYDAVKKQFNRAIKLAKKNGHAVAIAHPYPNTLKFLKKYLPSLVKSNIKLVSASTLLKTISDNSHEKSTDTISAGLRRTRSHYNN
ncbi:MAG: divergent polysaccharide deacetylase family protein, partial [Gammaproteobacteria bacterium]|nr:divergent polysaccharide deacetylase family protein [Gammaproteobacteria bacterium]